MQLPSRFRHAFNPWIGQIGLYPLSNGLYLSVGGEHLDQCGPFAAARGAKRIPRPLSRWSRRQAASKKSITRLKAACSSECRQKGRNMETQTLEKKVIRQELVARVRQEIVAGRYDTPAKLEAAFERLLNRIEQD